MAPFGDKVLSPDPRASPLRKGDHWLRYHVCVFTLLVCAVSFDTHTMTLHVECYYCFIFAASQYVSESSLLMSRKKATFESKLPARTMSKGARIQPTMKAFSHKQRKTPEQLSVQCMFKPMLALAKLVYRVGHPRITCNQVTFL